MSLLHRIAIENGDEIRKTTANLLIAEMDEKEIKAWNMLLLAEIHRKLKARDLGMFNGRSHHNGNG